MIEHFAPEVLPRVSLVSNIHDDVAPRVTTCEGRRGLLFVGNYDHLPNREAVSFLISHILPRLR